jgi:hypothetical protein
MHNLSHPGWKTDYSFLLCFQNLYSYIHPPLNIPTVPDWLNVKFHYFLIGPEVKILNTFNTIGSHLRNVVSSVVTSVNSLHLSYRFLLMCKCD